MKTDSITINTTQNKPIIALFLITLGNVVLLLTRNHLAGNTDHNFLLWNLFLGTIPFWIVLLMKFYENELNTYCLFLGWFLWLLFYPNSPYMITDLIHIKRLDKFVLYDSTVYFSLAILSAFWGFYSLKLLYSVIVSKGIKRNWATFIMVFSILLSSFGIYLGRILRLNSWDMLFNPYKTLITVTVELSNFLKDPNIYSMVLLYSFIQITFLYLISEIRYAK